MSLKRTTPYLANYEENAVNIDQNYFHNEDLSVAIDIDRYSRHFDHHDVKREGFLDFSFEL